MYRFFGLRHFPKDLALTFVNLSQFRHVFLHCFLFAKLLNASHKVVELEFWCEFHVPFAVCAHQLGKVFEFVTSALQGEFVSVCDQLRE